MLKLQVEKISNCYPYQERTKLLSETIDNKDFKQIQKERKEKIDLLEEQ